MVDKKMLRDKRTRVKYLIERTTSSMKIAQQNTNTAKVCRYVTGREV